MKRFGVQLAAGGIVILLGALGVAQAQRDSGTEESAQWDLQSTPAATPPPAPIAALEPESEDNAASGPSNLALGSFTFPASDGPTVRTVGHEEPQESPTSDSGASQPPTSQSDSLASDPPSVSASADMSPGWSLPAGAPPANAYGLPTAPVPTAVNAMTADAAAGPGMTLPSYDPATAQPAGSELAGSGPGDATSPPADGFAAMPTLQFDQQPGDGAAPTNGLREAGNDLRDGSDPNGQVADSMAAAGPAQLAMPVPSAPASEPNAVPLYPIDEPGPEAYAIPAGSAFSAEPAPAASMAPEAGPATDDSQSPAARIASRSREGLGDLGIGANPINDQPADTETVLAEPGDRRLEGVQTPSVVIHKRAPEEVKVGKPATFVIQVQNVGSVEALGVVVNDRVPVGMSLVDASPSPAVQGDLLSWELGAIEPGGERTVTLQLVPEKEGELGSVARVTFEAAASVRTISTRPELKITQRAPAQVLIGQQLEIELEVSNPGSGAATGVVMQEDVPEGLEHPKGRQLDNVIGTLAPGEVRRQVLRLRAVGAGQIENRIRLTGDDGLTSEHAVTVQVVAPQLAIELEGPSRRFLERQATFNVNLANVGTADATNVEIVAYLDRGFSFVGTEYQGQYDPARHAVYWSLAELPAEGRGSVPLKLLPIEQGERAIRLEAKGDLNAIAQYEKNVSVDTLAELTFSITDDADPIEVGSEATYEIRISNRGSRDDTDVKMQMQLPAGLELVSSEAEASTDGRGLIAFAPTMSLPAGGETIHRVRVRGVAAGTHVVKAIVTSAQATVPVTKEESTMVYADK
ncbi:MAG: hypothetical protein ACO1RT_01005 [Planctomycetaceae bacterium]